MCMCFDGECYHIKPKKHYNSKHRRKNKNMEIYFKATTTQDDDGFMMCDCGRSNDDNGAKWVVTTNYLKADEIPTECCDAETFAKLVAELLNKHYNT